MTLYHFCTMNQGKDGNLNYSDGTLGSELNLAVSKNYDKIKDDLAAIMKPPTTRKKHGAFVLDGD